VISWLAERWNSLARIFTGIVDTSVAPIMQDAVCGAEQGKQLLCSYKTRHSQQYPVKVLKIACNYGYKCQRQFFNLTASYQRSRSFPYYSISLFHSSADIPVSKRSQKLKVMSITIGKVPDYSV